MKNQRKELSHRLKDLQKKLFDVIVIGGGATGLGCALDATLRGYSTLLLEKDDFASGTSSKSTKMVHGGVRYLEQLDIPLVIQALYERGLLLKNAPEIVKTIPFIIPAYSLYEKPYYFTGLKLYDLLAGINGIGFSKLLSKETTRNKFQNIQTEGLKGSIMYYDAQFDDALLAMSLVQSTISHGGICANYCKVIELEKNNNGQLTGVRAEDKIGKNILNFRAKSIINATGIFSNKILKEDKADSPTRILTSRGSHIVVPQEKFPKDHALLVPKTKDGRVIFAVPWYDKVIIGTTDIVDPYVTNQPKVSRKEINYILETINQFLDTELTHADITSTYCGLRPLVKSKNKESSKSISRRHKVEKSESGLISILGGKWTTYRAMAEDTIDTIVNYGMLPEAKCQTKNFKLKSPNKGQKLFNNEELNVDFLTELIEYQMVTSLADILSRRSRGILLDVEKSRGNAKIISEHIKKLNVDIDVDLDTYEEFTKAFDFRL